MRQIELPDPEELGFNTIPPSVWKTQFIREIQRENLELKRRKMFKQVIVWTVGALLGIAAMTLVLTVFSASLLGLTFAQRISPGVLSIIHH